MQLRRVTSHARSLGCVAALCALGAGACVSLISSSPGSGNGPVVRGPFKNGRDQIVRIALATNERGGAEFIPGLKGQFVVPHGNDFVLWKGKRYRGEIEIAATDSGFLVVNRLSMDDYLRGVVPLEIGNRTSAEMAGGQAQAVAARTYAYKPLTDARSFGMYS